MQLATIEALLPDLAHASRVALRLQQDGPLQLPVKDQYDSPMGQALTIADPVIQAFLEASLPPARMELEEEPYRFRPITDEGPEGTVWVDPIDGTRYYADGLPIFGISLGWSRAGRMTASVYVVPAEGVAYVAARGEGTFVMGLPGFEAEGVRRRVEPTTGEYVIWSRAPEGTAEQLASAGLVLVDPDGDYDASRAKPWFHVLEGPVGGIVARGGAHARDGAAVALLAQEAGIPVHLRDGTDWDGAIDGRGRSKPIVVGATLELAERLRQLVR